MSARAAVFIATSLDGFIAREDGSLDWLSEASAGLPEGEDCGYGDFMAGIDAIFMGRKTFEQVLGFGAWPYGRTEMVVMSRQGVAIRSEPGAKRREAPPVVRSRSSRWSWAPASRSSPSSRRRSGCGWSARRSTAAASCSCAMPWAPMPRSARCPPEPSVAGTVGAAPTDLGRSWPRV